MPATIPPNRPEDENRKAIRIIMTGQGMIALMFVISVPVIFFLIF